MDPFQELAESESLTQLVVILLQNDCTVVPLLCLSSPIFQRHIDSNVEKICKLTWNISSDKNIDWKQEFNLILKNQYDALTCSMSVMGFDDPKTLSNPAALSYVTASQSFHKTSPLKNDPRGTLKILYTEKLPTRAKPLTGLSLSYVAEHSEVAVLSPTKPIGFHPMPGPGVKYYEITITSLAKRFGGPTIGFSLRAPYALPGGTWYSYGFCLDSGIVRNGIGVVPVTNVNDGRLPRVGDVYGVGYVVHQSHEAFVDDDRCVQPAGTPASLTFFCTVNGKIKHRMYLEYSPIEMYPVIVLHSTNDGVVANLSGDKAHPWKFNISTVSRWPEPEKIRVNGHQSLPLRPSLLKSPSIPYTPISEKSLVVGLTLLGTWSDKSQTLVSSYPIIEDAMIKSVTNAKPLTIIGSNELLQRDISSYYMSISPLLTKDEALNLLLELDTESQTTMNSEDPAAELGAFAAKTSAGCALALCAYAYEYILSFSKPSTFLDVHGNPAVATGDQYLKQYFHPEFPIPMSKDTHAAITYMLLATDASTLNLQDGIYQDMNEIFSMIQSYPVQDILKHVAVEIGWLEAQLQRIYLGLPTSPHPQMNALSSSPHAHIDIAPNYLGLFNQLTPLVSLQIIELDLRDIQFDSKLDEIVDSVDPHWAYMYIWGVITSIPYSQWSTRHQVGGNVPYIPVDIREAFKFVLRLISQERTRLATKELDPVNRICLQQHVSDIIALYKQTKTGMISIRDMPTLSQQAAEQFMESLSIPSADDPPVPLTPELHADILAFIAIQATHLAWLFGRDHPLLAPIIQMMASAQIDNEKALEMARAEVAKEIPVDWTKSQMIAEELQNQALAVNQPKTKEKQKSTTQKSRSSSTMTYWAIGLGAAAALGVIGSLGYIFMRKRKQ